MQINTNISSLDAQRSYRRAGEDMAASMRKLSSGLRINSASDDSAGLAVSSRMTAIVGGLRQARQNINDGISLLQVADGAAGEIVSNYQRLRELAVQAANGTNSSVDRAAIQQEADALMAANQSIGAAATYNGHNLLDGLFSEQLQVGASANQTVNVIIPQAVVLPRYQLTMVDISPQQATVNGTAVQGALATGDLAFNGVAVHASVAGAQPGQSAGSAYALAAAINGTAIKNISASATNTLSGSVGSSGAIAAGGITVNGISIGAITGATAAARAASAAGAISAAAGSSGVTASASGGTLTLSAADGRDIVISESGGGNAASLGLPLGAQSGTLSVSDAPLPGSHKLTVGGNNPALAGLSALKQDSVHVSAPDLELEPTFVAGEPPLDLSTVSGASAALDYIDGKIGTLNDVRSMLGATSNRLTAAAGNAEATATNLEQARSRIVDTDYASETVTLTRTRILAQAGASIVAQANAEPNRALQLLR